MKFSKEEEEFFLEKIKEAEESIKLYGTRPIEELWAELDSLKEEERRKEKLRRKSTKFDTAKHLKKVLKKSINT